MNLDLGPHGGGVIVALVALMLIVGLGGGAVVALR